MSRTVTLKRFKKLGLTSYEAKSYLSLLERDTLTVTEVSRIAGIPRTNGYEALEKLLSKGLCISKPGKTKQYSASDPVLLEEKAIAEIDNALKIEENDLYKKQEEILQKKKLARENISNLVKELTPLYKNSRSNNSPLDYIEVIKDPYQVHKRFLELVGQTKKELLGFSKPPYSVNRETRKEQRTQQAELRKAGEIRCMTIHEIPENKEDLQWKFELLNKFAEFGDKNRVIAELPMKMAIFDEKIVILPLEDPISTGKSFTTQIVEHPAMAKSLRMLFYYVWEQAEDYHIMEDLLKKM